MQRSLRNFRSVKMIAAFFVVLLTFGSHLLHAQQGVNFEKLEIIDANNAMHLSLLGTLVGHTDSVDVLAFSPDSQRLISSDIDGIDRLWDVKTFTNTLLDYRIMAISSDWKLLACHDFNKMQQSVTTIKIIDMKTKSLISKLPTTGGITSAAFNDNNHLLLVAEGWGREDFAVRVWEINEGEILHSFGGVGFSFRVAFSSDGNTAAASYFDVVRLWDSETWREKDFLGHDIMGLSVEIAAIAFDSQEILAVLSSDGFIWLWDANSGEEIGFLSDASIDFDMTYTRYGIPSQGLDFSPDDSLLISAGGDILRIWDVKQEKSLISLNYPTSSVVFSPNGKLIATADRHNRNIYLWGVFSKP